MGRNGDVLTKRWHLEVLRNLMNAQAEMAASEAREVMNLREASHYLGVSPDTLYRYISENEIPAFKLGNRWKFKKTILDRWMEKKIHLETKGKRR